MLKQTIMAFAILGAFASAANADCNEVLQELINERELTQIALLQSGGIISAQGITMEKAHCKKVTQRLLNKGNITQIALLQTGGEQYLQYILLK